MKDWISVSERLPEVKEDRYGSRRSDLVPIIVEGHEGWQVGEYIQREDYSYFRILGWNGDHVVTHWYPLVIPEESK